MAHKFDPDRKALLESPDRREWQDPETILDFFGFTAGTVVADVGCGTGYFSIPLSRRVGPAGRVYAIDMQEEMLWSLQEKLLDQGVSNILPILSSEEFIALPESHADAALLVNTLHELKGRSTLMEIHRILRTGGFLAVVDWAKVPMDVGPPLEHRLSEEQAKELLRSVGFGVDSVDVGDLFYGIRARRP